MILIGLGANLPSNVGDPAVTLAMALKRLEERAVQIVAISRFYLTVAWPDPADPPYINAAARIETVLPPDKLLALLHSVETEFGRHRSNPTSTELVAGNAAGHQKTEMGPQRINMPRPLDLDLLDYNGVIQGGVPVLPHPRMTERNFVLVPLADVAPGWRDPVSGRTVEALAALLPPLAPL